MTRSLWRPALFLLMGFLMGGNSAGADDAISLAAGSGSDKLCLVRNGRIRCLGPNHGFDSSFFQVPSIRSASQVSVGITHACAIAQDGLRCWGYGIMPMQPENPAWIRGASRVAAGQKQNCLIDSGRVHCWGGPEPEKHLPSGLSETTQLVAGKNHFCALSAGRVRCWSDSSDLDAKIRWEPPADLEYPVSRVAAGGHHSCAIDAVGLKCWGRNEFHQIEVPRALYDPTEVALGYWHSCAIDRTGVKCWGRNAHGECAVPEGLRHPTHLAAGDGFTCAWTDDGLRCWGDKKVVPYIKYGTTFFP